VFRWRTASKVIVVKGLSRTIHPSGSSNGALFLLRENLNTEEIVIVIDAEITLLQQARNLLHDEKPHKRRTLSAEARAKIAASQKKSWAKRRKTK